MELSAPIGDDGISAWRLLRWIRVLPCRISGGCQLRPVCCCSLGLKSTEGAGVAMAVRRLGQQQVTNIGVGMRSSHPSTTPDRIEGSCPTDAAPSRLATPATHLIELPKPAVVEAKGHAHASRSCPARRGEGAGARCGIREPLGKSLACFSRRPRR